MQAIEVLKAFEKKDLALKAKAATNLSFLYFLEGDIAQADQFANLAVRNDRYNAKALVNKGNCLNERGEHDRAKELYLEAIGVEADCIEAIYNLGLVNKHMGVLTEALQVRACRYAFQYAPTIAFSNATAVLQAFEKLHTIVPNSPEVIFQIANLHDMLGNFRAAAKYFSYLISKVRRRAFRECKWRAFRECKWPRRPRTACAGGDVVTAPDAAAVVLGRSPRTRARSHGWDRLCRRTKTRRRRTTTILR